MSSNLESSAVATELEKVSFHSNPKVGQCQNVQTTIQLQSFHMLAMLCSKSSKLAVHEPKTSRCTNWVLKMQKNQEIKLPTFAGSQRKQREFQKNIYFCFTTTLKPLTVWITTNWKILKEMGIPYHLTSLLCNLFAGQDRTLHETMDWSTLGMEYDKAVYCHPAYLTTMQGTSCKMLCWMKHKLESRLQGAISTVSCMQMITLSQQKAKRN